jgi:hypothetical protein
MIAGSGGYTPTVDDPSISVRDLHEMLATVRSVDDLRLIRRFVAMLCEGIPAEEAWDTLGLREKLGPLSTDEDRREATRRMLEELSLRRITRR